jgi:hypothetical protein
MSLGLLVKTDFLQHAKDQAISTIKKDRDQYSAVWETIDKYCKDHKLIISNVYALLKTTNGLSALFYKTYKIYTSNPFRHANALANEIHKHMLDDEKRQYTKLRTVLEHEEFIIDYDCRVVVYIYKLQKHKSVEPIDIIKPVNIANIYYMPSEIELIDIYHQLYKMNELEQNTQYEELLFNQVSKRKESGILGSGCKELKKQYLEAVKVDLCLNWIMSTEKKQILIGAWAHDWIILGKDKLCSNVEKIQIISDMSHTEVLTSLNKYMKLSNIRLTVTMREQELHIPKDFRTSRYTYYVNVDTERGIVEKPFLDLFNCAEFEVVPYYIIDNMNIGYKYVILRFLFIDLWIIRVIKTLGLLTSDVLNKKLIYIWKLIEYFRQLDTFSEWNFIGTHIDAVIYKKINTVNEKLYHPYYPEIYKKIHNSYREI